VSAVAAEDLTVVRGGRKLIGGLSVSLGPTGSVALIGPNGAGKSTLVKMLAGIENPTAGRVLVAGKDLSQLSTRARAEMIGYVPQHFEPHWDLTVAELVDLGAERAAHLPGDAVAAATTAYELAGLTHRRWSTLSGGERARVLLAMVLVVDPPTLLADEPGASLDIRHRIDVVKTLVRRSKARLSVVVMHDLDLAFRYFERVIVIDRGSIVADAAPSDLINDERLDTTFGVTFERLATPYGPLLRAT
jgi:iron complex transport system ATP-binding protein